MEKTVIKYFGGFMTAQEKWLNKMAANGRRLTGTTSITFDFDDCKPSEYEYRVEFAAHKSFGELEKYRVFLEECGYKVFYKNMNLNFSFLKFRLRIGGSRKGMFAANPGNYNKELMIVEKKADGKPFELHTDFADKATCCSHIALMKASNALIWVALSFFVKYVNSDVALRGVFLALGALMMLPAFFWTHRAIRFKKQMRISE